MVTELDDLTSLKQDAFWQLTAEREGGLIVVMRGHKDAPFEKRFYTMRSRSEAGYPVVGRWLRDESTAGRLKVLHGSVPADDNE